MTSFETRFVHLTGEEQSDVIEQLLDILGYKLVREYPQYEHYSEVKIVEIKVERE